MNKNNSYKQNLIAFYFFIFSLGLIISFIVIDMIYLSEKSHKTLLKNINEKAIQNQNYLNNIFKGSENILINMKESNLYKRFLSTKDSQNLEELFLLIAKNHKNIMNIKYIDKDGLEKARVNRNAIAAKISLVKEEELQDKSQRDYFKKSKTILNEKIWFTNIDLNMENRKIQKPINPTLMAILTIKQDGLFNGIIVINYFMKEFLETLSNGSLYDSILINKKGYALTHYEKSKSWGFYRTPKKTIESDFPNSYNKILSQEVFTKDNFTSLRLNIPTQDDLILIVKLKNSFLEQALKDKIQRYLIVSMLVLALSFILSIIFSRYLKKVYFQLEDTKKQNITLDEKVKTKTKQLQDSKRQITDILDNIVDFVWQIDKNDTYTYASSQVEKILGYKDEDIIGKTPFDFMEKDEAKRVKKVFEELKEKKLPIRELINKNIHKEGSDVWFEINANPIFDENKNLVGYRGTHRDITKRRYQDEKIKKINNKLKELNRTLEHRVEEEIEKNKLHEMQLFNQAKMAAMGDMLGNIAHQWRQPLSYISTTASGIKLNYEFNMLKQEDIPHTMDEIVSKTQYLSQTIETFRNFLKEKKEYQEAILQDRVEIALNIVNATLKDNHIYLEKVLDYTQPIKTKIVVGELSEVIINIVNNAKDVLIMRKTPNPWIIIELVQIENKAILTIEDNGGGIDKEVMPRIFEPYYTTKELSEGTGLGLYMSYKIVTESLKGKLHVENSEFGAKFIVELPLNN